MKFVIRQDEHMPLGRLLEYLETSVQRCPQQVEVRDYVKNVKAEQHRYYRGPILGQIAKHLADCGQPKDPAVLHEMHRRWFQPVIGEFETTIEVDGKQIPFTQMVHKSTADNTTSEMAEFTESVIAYWATEHGVQFIDKRYDACPGS